MTDHAVGAHNLRNIVIPAGRDQRSSANALVDIVNSHAF
jgi:hypothetical protein